MTQRIILAGLAALLLAGTSPIAEVLCEPRPMLVKRLQATGDARLAAMGMRDPDTMLEVWSTPDGRWTLVQAQADGTVCILAMGLHWETLVPRDPA